MQGFLERGLVSKGMREIDGEIWVWEGGCGRGTLDVDIEGVEGVAGHGN